MMSSTTPLIFLDFLLTTVTTLTCVHISTTSLSLCLWRSQPAGHSMSISPFPHHGYLAPHPFE